MRDLTVQSCWFGVQSSGFFPFVPQRRTRTPSENVFLGQEFLRSTPYKQQTLAAGTVSKFKSSRRTLTVGMTRCDPAVGGPEGRVDPTRSGFVNESWVAKLNVRIPIEPRTGNLELLTLTRQLSQRSFRCGLWCRVGDARFAGVSSYGDGTSE